MGIAIQRCCDVLPAFARGEDVDKSVINSIYNVRTASSEIERAYRFSQAARALAELPDEDFVSALYIAMVDEVDRICNGNV